MTTSMDALLKLHSEFVRKGFTRKDSKRILAQLFVHFAISMGGLVVVLLSVNLLVRAVGLAFSTLGAVGIGSNTHTSTHSATSDKLWLNDLLSFLGFPFFMAMSATYWWRKHVQLHHSAPNVIDVDEDADLLPWFALTRRDVATGGNLKRWYFEHAQWWIFPLALAGNGFQIQVSGWIHLLGSLRNPRERRTKHWLDLFAMTMHYVIWIGVPCMFFSTGHVLLLYVLRIILIGYGMYAVVAPGHLPAEAARVQSGQEKGDYSLIQTACTVNFRTGPIGRWLCSGLQYQIEHHLFPSVSHVYYPDISPIVQAFCRRHGLPYRSYSWGRAVWLSWEALRQPQPIHAELETLRVNGS